MGNFALLKMYEMCMPAERIRTLEAMYFKLFFFRKKGKFLVCSMFSSVEPKNIFKRNYSRRLKRRRKENVRADLLRDR